MNDKTLRELAQENLKPLMEQGQRDIVKALEQEMMNGILKIAGAMGWTIDESMQSDHVVYWVNGDVTRAALPDNAPIKPFTDANDDYAVLEWMRENDLAHSLAWLNANNYQLGDYARAALQVIE